MLHHTLFTLLPFLSLHVLATPIARADSSGPSIKWGSCGNSSQIPAALECGQLVVPLDHNNPPSPDQYNANSTVTLGMSRLRAPGRNGTDTPGESLIINPGGPGGVAWVTLLLQLQAEAAGADRGIVSKELREKYDLIGLDPRGVGLSQAIKCDDSLLASRPDITIGSEDKWNALSDWNKKYGESCLAMSGELVRYVDTISVAKDFELFRQAIGEDKLNMIGLSYGTQIAAQYINLYPEHVGRLVLDAALDHTEDVLHASATDSTSFEATLNEYFAYCDASDECKGQLSANSSSSNGTSTTAAVFDSVLDKLSQGPLSASGCSTNGTAACLPQAGLREFMFAVQTGLQVQKLNPVFPTSWANVTADLAAASKGDGTPFSTSLVSDPAASLDAGGVILCVDNARIPSYEAYQRQRTAFAALYPHTKGISNSLTNALNCVGWPVEPTNLPKPLNKETTSKSAEVLMLASTLDPSTSVTWALSLREQLPQSRLVIRDGVGHTSYILFGESSDIAEKYLLDGALPEDNTVTQS